MRRSLVAVLAAALVGIPAVPAFATIEHCPEGVAEVRGTQPTLTQVNGWINAAAAEHDVPVAILRVIAFKESTWRQFASNGAPLVSSDGVCGLGIMQVTADDRADAVRLAEDGAYNVMEGAEILRAKWEISQQTAPPTGYAAEDPDVVENWYYALCLYNGCDGSSDAYAASAANILHAPFLYLPAQWKPWLPPVGFLKPSDVKPDYDFPNAFQARHTPTGGEFVFYDHVNGVVSEVVPARTHRFSLQTAVVYPQHALGPDAAGTQCMGCGLWRLADGTGLRGRTYWSTTITAAEAQAQVQWDDFPIVPGGRYRVDAFVPALGAETLGTPIYGFWDGVTWSTVTLNQNLKKNTWVPLTTRTFAQSASVNVSDVSTVAGQKFVADAVRLVPVPTLTLTNNGFSSVTHGSRANLTAMLSYPGGDPVAGRYVQMFRRPRGTTAWQGIGTWRTGGGGDVNVALTPDRNYEFTARFTPAPGDYLTSSASGVVRVDVRPRIAAIVDNGSPLSGDPSRIRTSVAPNHAGHAVQFQRWISGTGWRTVVYARLDANSRASWTFRLYNNGKCASPGIPYRYRVYKPADHDHAASASDPIDMLVHARCD